MGTKVWKCKAGSFTGHESSGCIHLTGIRYAQSERYSGPEPYIYPDGVHECNDPSPYCIQDEARIEGRLIGVWYHEFPQVESCQFLSVTMPDDVTEDSKLPVMVWYHGGAFKNGGCENHIYRRHRLSKEQNVIVVGVNYRLSVFGFVKDRDGNLANNGLLDAIEGLRWVKENISSFGGDPDNITVFGQSAGAEIVRCMLISDITEGLFSRAILQSVPLGTIPGRRSMDLKVLDELNTYPLDADPKELIAAQRKILSHVTEKSKAKEMVFAPHYGAYPLPDESEVPERLKKAAAKYPILIGSNTREVMAYVGGEPRLKRLYRFPLTRWYLKKVVDKATDDVFRVPIRNFADEYASYGGVTYYYDFHWKEDTFVGSCHGSELALLFDADGLPLGSDASVGLTATEINELGKEFRGVWGGFARDGTISKMSIDGMIKITRL